MLLCTNMHKYKSGPRPVACGTVLVILNFDDPLNPGVGNGGDRLSPQITLLPLRQNNVLSFSLRRRLFRMVRNHCVGCGAPCKTRERRFVKYFRVKLPSGECPP